jgi:glycosyltransferase involved in cell wall biosynthesis
MVAIFVSLPERLSEMPYRVLLLTDADVFAGTERHILELADSLRAAGVASMVGCPVPSPLAEKTAAAGVPVIAISKGGMLDTSAIKTLRRLLRTGEVDLIHAHNGRTALLAAAAKATAGQGRCMATQHFLAPSRVARTGAKAFVSRLAHRWVEGRMDHVIAISQAVRDGSMARGETAADRITTVYNGISPIARESLATPDHVRHELGLAADAPLIFCAGRLELEKDMATLIDAMRGVAGTHPNAVCAIAGSGSQDQDLRSRIERHGLTRRVRLLGFRTDVLSLMNAATLFVLPCPVEAFGLVFVEAMCLGKPVIATRAGGPLEIVEDEVTGLLVLPKDPVSLAGAINRLLSDKALRESMGERGRQRFLEHFTADRMAAATAAVYRKVLGGTAELATGTQPISSTP